MSRRWRLGLALLAMAGLLGLSCHQYQSLQAALPAPLQPDPRAAEYQALRKLAGALSRSLSEPGLAQDDVREFRARQRALGLFAAYVNSSPFRSELLLVADKPAWTEGWLSAASPTRLHEGLSGEANWIIPVPTGLSGPGGPDPPPAQDPGRTFARGSAPPRGGAARGFVAEAPRGPFGVPGGPAQAHTGRGPLP